MAVTANWFGNGPLHLANGDVDWVTDTIKVALTDGYTPDQDAHDFFNDVTGEISGTGYTAGGETLGTKTVTYDTATNETRLDAADTSWSSASFTADHAIVYMDSGSAATSPLLGYVNLDGDQTVSSGTFTITWASTGILKITAS